jgi:quercetin dioxygenase-like cupin family protein
MYTKGNVFHEQERKGWIYGAFMPEGPHHDERIEIKVAVWKKGSQNSYHYQKIATKIDIIWQGHVLWEIDGSDVELKKGDYVIVPPNIKTRIKNVLSDEAIVQTIKFPSLPEDKIIE